MDKTLNLEPCRQNDYQTPMVRISVFETEDVIRTSWGLEDSQFNDDQNFGEDIY